MKKTELPPAFFARPFSVTPRRTVLQFDARPNLFLNSFWSFKALRRTYEHKGRFDELGRFILGGRGKKFGFLVMYVVVIKRRVTFNFGRYFITIQAIVIVLK